MTASAGRLFGLGVGPGDPELITLKALRYLQQAPVVAYYAARGKTGNALRSVETYLGPEQLRLPLIYPVTTERLPPPFCYETTLRDFYDQAAAQVAVHLTSGNDVAVLCEGDPFFYGSFMYLHDRLATRFTTEVVPGVCAVVAGAAVLGTPLVYRNQTLTVLSATLPAADLRRALATTNAAAIIKLGAHFPKVRQVLEELGLLERAHYIARATMAAQQLQPVATVNPDEVPYFAMILLPGPRWEVH